MGRILFSILVYRLLFFSTINPSLLLFVSSSSVSSSLRLSANLFSSFKYHRITRLPLSFTLEKERVPASSSFSALHQNVHAIIYDCYLRIICEPLKCTDGFEPVKCPTNCSCIMCSAKRVEHDISLKTLTSTFRFVL